MSQRFKLGQRIAIIVLFSMACLLLIYSFRLTLLKTIANTWLQPRGIVLESISGFSINTRQLKIGNASLMVSAADSRITVDSLLLSYDWAEPMLGALVVDSIRIDSLGTKQTVQADPSTAFTLSNGLTQLGALPIGRIEVARINHSALPAPLQWHWQQQGQEQQWWIDNSHHSVQATLKVLGSGGLDIQLSLNHQQRAALAAHVQLLPAADRFKLNVDGVLSYQPLSAVLAYYTVLPDLPIRQGEADFMWQGSVPDSWSIPLEDETIRGSLTDATLRFELPSPLDETDSYSVSASLDEPIDIALPTAAGKPWQLAAQGLQLSVVNADKQHQLQAAVSSLLCTGSGIPVCEAELGWSLMVKAITMGEWQISQAVSRGQGRIEYSDGLLALTVHRDAEVNSSLSNPRISVPAIQWLAAAPLNIRYKPVTSELDIEGEQLELAIPALSDGSGNGLSTELALDAIALNYSGQWQGQLAINSNKLQLTMPEQWLPSLALQSQLDIAGDKLSVQGRVLNSRRKALADFSAGHQLQTQRGSARLQITTMAFDGKANALSNWLPGWPYPVVLSGGNLGLNAALDWHEHSDKLLLTGSAALTVEKLRGHVEDIGFAGLTLQHDLQLLADGTWRSRQAGALQLDLLEVGVPITAISSRLYIDTARRQIGMPQFSAGVLGGVVSASDFIYRADQVNLLRLAVEGLNIESLVALAAYDDVQATGRISGLLPVELAPDGIRIDAGRLAAVAPGGMIRYSANTAAVNPAMKLVNEALQNYHYDSLSSDVFYSKNGDLELKMQLRGQNPAMNQGQKINLNVNVSDNIPTLLKSLQGSRVITDVLKKNIK